MLHNIVDPRVNCKKQNVLKCRLATIFTHTKIVILEPNCVSRSLMAPFFKKNLHVFSTCVLSWFQMRSGGDRVVISGQGTQPVTYTGWPVKREHVKVGYSNEQETCDCGITQTMQHLLVCPMMDTACSPQNLTTANDIAIDCTNHWEGTI